MLCRIELPRNGRRIVAHRVWGLSYPGNTIRRDLIAPTDAELLAARAAYELAQANLEDAQNYLNILTGVETTDEVPASSVTSITGAKLVLNAAQSDLSATDLVAPVSGTITSISLNVGEGVGAISAVTISNFNQPYVLDAYLDETDWDKAKVGFPAIVTSSMYSRQWDGALSFVATITFSSRPQTLQT